MTLDGGEHPYQDAAEIEYIIGTPLLIVIVVVGFVLLIRTTGRAIDRGFAKMGETFGEAMGKALAPEFRDLRSDLVRLEMVVRGQIDRVVRVVRGRPRPGDERDG